ncbi:hypothetical protein TVAGG3_0717410 [Trichomonas vaginalis G3]|uniref:hypothetical protein n=1 Tax=Trichomonas vaginalis (strain ATCC PRA-98 / G3) TaxID=412133 RepID=UPI0021E6073A|nr:hypothetical protein TVAGG3_0717410 [Trichomonas vaginalis G3]KAI5510345.1 hypothetical protein TVAGG3_0717410 [Trichomonas vaginalis G3]
MFNLLVRTATSYLKESTPKNSDACFNIAYIDSNNEAFSITSQFQGFFVAYKVNNGNTQFIKKDQEKISSYKNTRIEAKLNNHVNNDFIFISFTVSNNNQEPIDFSLGIYADLQLLIPQSTIIPLDFRQGFTIKSNSESCSVLTHGLNSSTNADAFWYGTPDINNRRTLTTNPYWENLSNPQEIHGDIEMALSWQNRIIKAGETVEFGFTIGKGTSIKTPPKLILNTELQERYDPETKLSINFTVYDNDVNDDVTVFVYNSINQKTLNSSFKTNETFKHKYAIITKTLKHGIYNFQIWAVDSSDYTSNLIERTIYATKLPTIRIDNELGSYKRGENITIQGKVWDESFVHFHYKLDNDESYYTITEQKVTNNIETDFIITIPIPETLEGSNHTITIYATDEYGFKSESIVDKHFTLIEESEPDVPIEEENKIPSSPSSNVDDSNESPNEASKELTPAQKPDEKDKESKLIQSSESNHSALKDNSELTSNSDTNKNLGIGTNEVRPSKSNKSWIIPVVVVCIIIVIIVLVIGLIYFVHKKKNEGSQTDSSFDDMQETIAIVTSNSTPVTLDNPLFSTNLSNEEDDIFKDDFEEQKTEHLLYILHNNVDNT